MHLSLISARKNTGHCLHTDDAELAAFELYSQSYYHIVTITPGEIEMEDFAKYYDKPEKSSRLKGNA